MNNEQKKRALYAPLLRQKAAIVWLCVAVVLLGVALGVVQYIVSIYNYTDVDGAAYRIQKKDGVYTLCDKNGRVCELTPEGYYLTAAGTQLLVDEKSGEYEIFAKVDLEGSEMLNNGQYLTMFRRLTYSYDPADPTTRRENVIRSIEVTNEYGTYAFHRKQENGKYTGEFYIDGYPDTAYDETKFASLAVGCGYALAMERLENPVRTTDGGIDWSEYGLASEERERTENEVTTTYRYEPVCYTVTTLTDESHTVYLGDKTVSGNGYYARYAGRDRVYVLAATGLEETVMKSVEALVTPTLVYSMGGTTYYDVEDLTFHTNGKLVCSATYVPQSERTHSLYSTLPYQTDKDYANGYLPNSNSITDMLAALDTIDFTETVKLGPTAEDLKTYGLDNPLHRISFVYHIPSAEGGGNAQNEVLISQKNDEGLYYAYSPEYNMIVSMDASQVAFLEWTADKWYDREYFHYDIAHLKELTVISQKYKDVPMVFTLDNSLSDQSEGINSEKLLVAANGQLLDYRFLVNKWDGTVINRSGIDNFRLFYRGLLSASVEGLADLSEEEMAAHRARPDEECVLKLIAYLDDGQGTSSRLVFRFYEYSERRSYMTVEVLDGPDAASSGTAGTGEFCVLTSFCDKLIEDAYRVITRQEVVTESKN